MSESLWKKKFIIVISYYFVQKLLSDLMFDFGKYLFQKMHESESNVFWKRHFPQSNIESESSF